MKHALAVVTDTPTILVKSRDESQERMLVTIDRLNDTPREEALDLAKVFAKAEAVRDVAEDMAESLSEFGCVATVRPRRAAPNGGCDCWVCELVRRAHAEGL